MLITPQVLPHDTQVRTFLSRNLEVRAEERPAVPCRAEVGSPGGS